MNNIVYTKSFSPPPVVKSEILRYSGLEKASPKIQEMIDSCLDEVLSKLTYKVCYTNLPLFISGSITDLGFAKIDSSDLAKNLRDCSSIVLFAATVGIEIDRLICRYGRISPSRALLLQSSCHS